VQKRRLGKTDLEVSELSYGTWLTVAGGVDRQQAVRCIHAALDHGINLFDTANQYGAGEAERVLGEALKPQPRDRYLIATKLFFPVGDDPDHGLSAAQIEKQLNNSLQRLQVECIDLYQCHRYDPETPLEETLAALDRAVLAGKVRAIGVSEWTGKQIDTAAQLAARSKIAVPASVQSQYSILWRKPDQGALEACANHGMGFLAFSPLAHGVLSGKYRPGQAPPQQSRAANAEMNQFMETAGRHYRSDFVLEPVERLRPIAEELGITMAQMALAWVLQRPGVTSAIIGATRPEQIAENVGATQVNLSVDVLERIDEIVGAVVTRD
jgi:aryl-alcohol dehydrogenase-like predicted oxidoreductase